MTLKISTATRTVACLSYRQLGSLAINVYSLYKFEAYDWRQPVISTLCCADDGRR